MDKFDQSQTYYEFITPLTVVCPITSKYQ